MAVQPSILLLLSGFGATIDTTLLYNHCFTYPNAFVYCGWYWFSCALAGACHVLAESSVEAGYFLLVGA